MSGDIPRVWEVDWAIPAAEGGTAWDSYAWLLETAADLGADEVTILGSTYDNLANLDRAIGPRARTLRVLPHRYRHGQITVHGISTRGSWSLKGPVLIAWASDAIMTEVEAHRPPAIAAVASWPDDIAAWRSVFRPRRIGQERPEEEAEYAKVIVGDLDPTARKTLNAATGWVNKHHGGLDTDERERVAGALIGLAAEGVPVDTAALRAHLMADGWNGDLVAEVITLTERVAKGERPRHLPFPVQR